jgi:hypothetical protein
MRKNKKEMLSINGVMKLITPTSKDRGGRRFMGMTLKKVKLVQK